MCRGHKSPLTGKQVPVVAAGGIAEPCMMYCCMLCLFILISTMLALQTEEDGRHLAMSLALGADGVWVGTRFVASVEGGAPPKHKEATCREL